MTDAAKRIKQLEKGYDELRTVNNRLQALVEDVMDLGRDCAASITGFPEDSAAIQLPANAIAAIKEELRLGRARHNEATEIEARLAEAEQQASDARVSWGLLSLVAAERKRQDERWGPAHDDEHTTADFVRFIEHYAGLARGAEMQDDPDEARKRLVQVAALAVAAAESIERKFLRCPAPLHGDDGTVADCIAKGHCGCDAKPLAPSGGSESGVSAHTGATKATDGTTPKATDQ